MQLHLSIHVVPKPSQNTSPKTHPDKGQWSGEVSTRFTRCASGGGETILHRPVCQVELREDPEVELVQRAQAWTSAWARTTCPTQLAIPITFILKFLFRARTTCPTQLAITIRTCMRRRTLESEGKREVPLKDISRGTVASRTLCPWADTESTGNQ